MFCIRYPDGKFVHIDSSSGGYPCKVDDNNYNSISFLWSSVEAEDYIKSFPRENFQIVEVELKLRIPNYVHKP